MLVAVERKLSKLARPHAFVGGATIPVWIDDEASPPIRNTLDVDVLIKIEDFFEYAHEFSKQLRALGAVEDTREDAPRCRWILNGITLDVLPTSAEVLGFASRFYPRCLEHRVSAEINGESVPLISAAWLLVTKVEAHLSRGDGDFFSSKDMEDIVALFDGRSSLPDELAKLDFDVVDFVRQWISTWLKASDFEDSLAGHLGGDYDRSRIVRNRMNSFLEATAIDQKP